MPGKMFVEPFGGLGNRMRVIVSALSLASQADKSLEIIWCMGPDLNCEFHKLFEVPSQFKIRNRRVNQTVYSSFNKSAIKRQAIRIYNWFYGFDIVVESQDHLKVFRDKELSLEMLAHHKNIYIRSCEQFFPGNQWKIFVPVQEIQTKIQKITDHFTAHTIGVHIRRNDNTQSIEKSPLQAFIIRMEQFIEKDSRTKFFIATDDESVLAKIQSVFATDTLIVYQKEYGRSTEKGIQDGLVEMFCLSECTAILGSYWSSYSEVASYINDVPLITATGK